jgi:hypothetical protein
MNSKDGRDSCLAGPAAVGVIADASLRKAVKHGARKLYVTRARIPTSLNARSCILPLFLGHCQQPANNCANTCGISLLVSAWQMTDMRSKVGNSPREAKAETQSQSIDRHFVHTNSSTACFVITYLLYTSRAADACSQCDEYNKTKSSYSELLGFANFVHRPVF